MNFLKKIFSRQYVRARNIRDALSGKEFSFVTLHDLVDWTDEWIKKEEWDFDLIVGIPRSGLLVANILSLRLALPLTTLDLAGKSAWISRQIENKHPYKKVLLVDDSLSSGESMRKAVEELKARLPDAEITTAALIINPGSESFVNRFFIALPQPRIFEWNMLHAKKGSTVGFDIDGVLSEEIPLNLEADEEKYIEWITNARPYLVPTYEIDVIVSNRLERYRAHTEDWLARHNVKYKKLIMCPAQSKAERKLLDPKHKVTVLLQEKPHIFFESSPEESSELSAKTGIPVICVEDKTLY